MIAHFDLFCQAFSPSYGKKDFLKSSFLKAILENFTFYEITLSEELTPGSIRAIIELSFISVFCRKSGFVFINFTKE